ncbi:MAG: mechanosensitive ion channel [Alphaproteobacteria bacterium]|nr:mechanosensitive ion channel [Alphaproteobacteria bacterium]
MLETFDIDKIWNTLVTWCGEHFWSIYTLYQVLIIIASFIIGAVFYRIVKRKSSQIIDNLEIPIRVKRSLNNIQRLIFHLTTLCMMFLITQLVSLALVDMNIYLIEGIMKVLLAWIVIRIALQFVGNNMLRNFFALSIWIVAALSIFGILEQTATMLDAFGFNIGTFRLSTLAVIKGTFALFILLYLATFVSTFAERHVLRSKSLTRSSQVLIAKIVRITLITFALLIGVTSAGIDLSIFTVFSGAVGLGIGFGLQKVVSNLFSGLLLLMDKSITPGDIIELENSGTFGWVNNMGARYTEIITHDNKSYLIPNEDFITNRVINWSHGNNLIRIETTFGVHYNSDPHQVIELAAKAAAIPERVIETPKAVCWLTEFGDSSLNFSLRFWIKDAQKGITNVTGEVMLSLWDTFKEHNIEIPYPHREVFIHNK